MLNNEKDESSCKVDAGLSLKPEQSQPATPENGTPSHHVMFHCLNCGFQAYMPW